METIKKQIALFCKNIASDRRLVQAAGGNVSWKEGNELWIKASGTWLADAAKKEIFVPVDLDAVRHAIDSDDFAYTPCALHGYALRPSIETLLHALMPQRIVVHLHPVDAVAHLIQSEPRQALEHLLGDTVAWTMVPYQKPGAALAQAVRQALDNHRFAKIAMLQNHGLILGGETLEEIEAQLMQVMEKLRPSSITSTKEPQSYQQDVKIATHLPGYRACRQRELHALATDPQLYARLQHGWAICPDHLVFLGPLAACLEPTPVTHWASHGFHANAPFVFVRGQGVLERDDVTEAQLAQLLFYYDVMCNLPTTAPLQTLTEDQVTELLNWDAEKYRQQLNRNAP